MYIYDTKKCSRRPLTYNVQVNLYKLWTKLNGKLVPVILNKSQEPHYIYTHEL